MTNPMPQRISRAFCCPDGGCRIERANHDVSGARIMDLRCHASDTEYEARAAIAAIREPTNAMLAVGDGQVWRRMVDAALSESGEMLHVKQSRRA